MNRTFIALILCGCLLFEYRVVAGTGVVPVAKSESSFREICSKVLPMTKRVAKYGLVLAGLLGFGALQYVTVNRAQRVSPMLSSSISLLFNGLGLAFFTMPLFSPISNRITHFVYHFQSDDDVQHSASDNKALEDLWARSHATYSQNASMARNIYAAFGTFLNASVHRTMRWIDKGDLDVAAESLVTAVTIRWRHFADIVVGGWFEDHHLFALRRLKPAIRNDLAARTKKLLLAAVDEGERTTAERIVWQQCIERWLGVEPVTSADGSEFSR